MKTSEKLDLFSSAFIKAQKELQNLKPEKEGYGYKYVPLSDLINHIKPILNNNSLAFIQTVSESEKGVSIATRIMHESGQFIEDSYSLPPTTIKNVNEVQALGSSITYGRRYGLNSMCGIASDEDIDGTGNTSQPKQETNATIEKAKEIFKGDVIKNLSKDDTKKSIQELTHLEQIQQSTKINEQQKAELTKQYNTKPDGAKKVYFNNFILKQL